MRSGAEIAAQIKSKMAETAKNEVIALSEEEFEKFVNGSECYCPSDFGLRNSDDCRGMFGNVGGVCDECWKKATGRK